RAAVRNLDRQGGRRDPGAVGRGPCRDQGSGGTDRSGPDARGGYRNRQGRLHDRSPLRRSPAGARSFGGCGRVAAPSSAARVRVTKTDMLGALVRGVSVPVPTPAGTAARSPLPSAGPVVHPVVQPWPGDRVEPFSKIRKITADHMIMSRRTSAHVTSFFEIDY